MRVFRSTYKDRGGKTKKTAKWYIEMRDSLQIVRRFVGFTDKRQTEALGRRIEQLVATKISGEQPSAELSRWLEHVPTIMRERFAKVGLLDKSRVAGSRPLAEHLEDFRAHLEAKGNTADHVKKTVSRIRRVVKGAGFRTWTDLSANKVQRYLHGLRKGEAGLSAKTFNYYLQSVKQFCTWMVDERRASENPLSYLKAINAEMDKRHPRRSLEVDEARALLRVAQQGPTCMGITGPERAMLYRLACESGLRLNELRSLLVSSFDFEACTVSVRAAYSKRRRYDTLPLKSDSAKVLREFLKDKLPKARALRVPPRGHEAEMLRVDLEPAGIEYVDDAGRFADFHSLRHTTG
jgi:site-specific recombinase XerC